MDVAKDSYSLVKLFRRVAFDLLLLVGFYIPFGLMTMFASYNSKGGRVGSPNWSLSTLGWKEGNYWMLIVYVVFVIFFFSYQINLFIKLSGRKQKVLNILKYIAIALLLVGSCLPVDKNYDPSNPVWTNATTRFFDFLHCTLCQIGIGLFGVILIIMVVKFYLDTVNNRRTKRQMVAFAYILTATLVFGLVEFWVAAFFEVWATFMAMCFASYITVSYELAEKKPEIFNQGVAVIEQDT